MDQTLKIKVDKKVKPILPEKRKKAALVVDKEYYVSFGSNVAYKCTLKEVDERGRIVITYTAKAGRKTKHHSGFVVCSAYLYSDEIGETPEGAVRNEVTY